MAKKLLYRDSTTGDNFVVNTVANSTGANTADVVELNSSQKVDVTLLPTATVGGVGSASKVPLLTAQGKIPIDMLDADTVSATSAEAMTGTVNFVSFDSTGKVVRAIANDVTKKAKGYVLGTVAVNDVVTVYFFTPITGLSGLTPNGLVFLSTTAGGYTQTVPATTTGNYEQILGYATSATVMQVEIMPKVTVF